MLNLSETLDPLRRRIADLAALIAGKPEFRWAIVTAAKPLRIQFDGDDLPLAGSPSTTVQGLAVGDRVRVELQNRRATVTGRSGPPAPKLLWSGPGYYMNANQVVNLNEPVASQATGIVLVWKQYLNGAAVNQQIVEHFVSKGRVADATGSADLLLIPRYSGTNAGLTPAQKYIYMGATALTGHESNHLGLGTSHVLVAVYGV